MLEVLPIQLKSEQEALCARCGVAYDADLMAYGARVDGEPAGICQFSINEDGGSIINISCVTDREDFEVAFVLGRAALNFMDLCGAQSAHYDGELNGNEQERLVRAVGFSKNSDGRYSVDLTGFFTSPCSHSKK